MVQPITGQLWTRHEESWQNNLGQGNLAIKTFAQLGKAGRSGRMYFAKVPGAILRRGFTSEENKIYSCHKHNPGSRFKAQPIVDDQRSLGKMKLNEPGRQKLGSQKPCQQA